MTKPRTLLAGLAGLMLVTTGCSAKAHADAPAATGSAPTSSAVAAASEAEARIDAVQVEVSRWMNAGSLTEAKAAAEAARNLVLGPYVTGYGDADDDGTIGGSNTFGLLGRAPAEVERCALHGGALLVAGSMTVRTIEPDGHGDGPLSFLITQHGQDALLFERGRMSTARAVIAATQ